MLDPLSIDTLGLNAPVGSAKEGETPMLFVALLKIRGHATFREGVARQMQWDYPEGVRVQI